MSSETAPKTPSKLTREDLYRQVWETPLQHLAAQYGITGNGLAKICDRLNVPYPYRGYWAKKAANKPVKRLSLPALKNSTPAEVTIAPSSPRRLLPTQSLPQMLQVKYDEAKSKAAKARVPANLRKPHAVIANWIADHAKRVADARRFGMSFSPPRLTELDRRRHLILDTLFKELEVRGYKIKAEQYRDAWLEIGKQRVEFKLTERVRQIRRRLTDQEKRESGYQNQEWRQERVSTGLLTFKITTPLTAGVPVQWIDDPHAQLEEKIDEIIAVFDLAVPILKEKRRIAEEAERKRHEEERLRYEKQEKQKQDRNRWRRFMELAKQWQSASVARAFLALLEELPATTGEFGGRTHAEWLQWVREELDVFDPSKYESGDIWESLASVNSWTYRD
jgi:hypothetical protein